MASGYESDDILSQALDLYESTHEECGDIFLTQNTFLAVPEGEKADIHRILRDACDVSEMLLDGGPCLMGATRMPPIVQQGISNLEQKPPQLCTATTEAENPGTPNIEHKHQVNTSISEAESTGSTSRFKAPSLKEVAKIQTKFVPPNTERKNKWATNLFDKWREHMIKQEDTPTDLSLVKNVLSQNSLLTMTNDELNIVLPVFFMSVKKENGQEYKNESVYALACAIQRYMQANGRKFDIFNDDTLVPIRNAVDNVMQEKCKQGVGLIKNQSDIITVDQEHYLWDNGFLAIDYPRTLLNTMFWVVGVNFGLRGGEEHRNLTFENFSVVTDQSKRRYLCYTETATKTNRGGLQHRGVAPHSSRAYENYDEPSKCPVRIFQLYKERLPQSIPKAAFYFRPVQHVPIVGKPWFTNQPLGHNSLRSIVKDLMIAAGFAGKYTNHSLRATVASRLFHVNVPEQIIREQTGHRSNAIFAYKRTSDEQKCGVSDILQLKANPETPVTPPVGIKRQKTDTTMPEIPNIAMNSCSNITFVFQSKQ